MVAEKNPEIKKAVNTLYELSVDEKVQAEYEMRQKAWRDRLSQNEGYYREGRVDERKHFMELLNQGLTIEEIKQRLT